MFALVTFIIVFLLGGLICVNVGYLTEFHYGLGIFLLNIFVALAVGYHNVF